jgi:hypothetical protein
MALVSCTFWLGTAQLVRWLELRKERPGVKVVVRGGLDVPFWKKLSPFGRTAREENDGSLIKG